MEQEEKYYGWKEIVTIRKVNAICYELRLCDMRLMTVHSEERAKNKRDAILAIIGKQRQEARALLECELKGV